MIPSNEYKMLDESVKMSLKEAIYTDEDKFVVYDANDELIGSENVETQVKNKRETTKWLICK